MTLNKRNQRTAEWCCDHDNLLPGEAQRRLGVGKQQREEKLSAEWCMRRIDPRIRTVFQHNRHLPMVGRVGTHSLTQYHDLPLKLHIMHLPTSNYVL